MSLLQSLHRPLPRVAAAPTGALSRPLHRSSSCRTGPRCRPGGVVVRAQGKDGGGSPIEGVAKAGGSLVNGVADAAVSFVPRSVPRPVAKTAVVGAAGLLVFSLVQKLLSVIVFLALLGGAVFLWSSVSSEDKSGGSSSGGGGGSGDPLADARKILDKYK